MSTTPPIPEHLRPLAPGYTPRQVEIDAQMVALGRPHLPLSALFNVAARAAWRADVEAWEQANPDGAIRWRELFGQAVAADMELYEQRYGHEAFQCEQMRMAGFPEALVAKAARELRENACFTTTRDWLRDGTTWCLVLTGLPGCGKTQAATWAAFQLMLRNFAPRFVQCIKRCDSPLFGVEAEEYRWRCATAGALVLDDLGEGEQRNEKRSAWRGWVDDVLSQRYDARRKTVITTNRSTAELAAWLGARLVDRLNTGVIVSTNEASLRGREPGED